jgi:hypothetical protein
MRPNRFTSRRLAAIFVPTAIALAACGGSDDPPAAAGPASSTLTLTGTAATGAAIAGGTVDAKCATGNGSAATVADGSYTLAIEGGALPCSLRVTSADGATVLHSAATGSGSSARANITPATELAMAQLFGRSPADAHAAFDAAALTPAALDNATSAITTLLTTAGVTISGNPLSGALDVGDANDQALDLLKANLEASGTTLAEASNAIVADKGGTPGGAVPPMPLAQLLAASAPNCKALRSGKYRVVFAGPAPEAGQAFTDTVTLDAKTLLVTGSDGVVDSLIPNGDCRYLTPSGELAVTSAGLGVLRSEEEPGRLALGLVFPEQVHPVSATEDTWNLIGLGDIDSDNGQGTPRVFAGTISFDATGRSVGTTVFCENLRDCVNEAPLASEVHTVNPGGGFNFDGGRNFVYKLASGQKLLVAHAADGAFILATPKMPRPAPVIGTVNRSLNFTLTPTYTANALPSISQNTIRSFDAATGTFIRDAIVNFNTGVTQPERIEINRFLEGFSHRIPEQVIDSAGANRSVGEWVVLSLPEMGFVPVAFPGNNNLVLSVTQPAP